MICISIIMSRYSDNFLFIVIHDGSFRWIITTKFFHRQHVPCGQLDTYQIELLICKDHRGKRSYSHIIFNYHIILIKYKDNSNDCKGIVIIKI